MAYYSLFLPLVVTGVITLIWFAVRSGLRSLESYRVRAQSAKTVGELWRLETELRAAVARHQRFRLVSGRARAIEGTIRARRLSKLGLR